MDLIFSSKMFKSSKNKDRVRAAMNNPLNTELVTQLRSYLDEEYQTEEFLDDNKVKKDVPEDETKEVMVEDEFDKEFDSESRGSSAKAPSSPPKSAPPSSEDRSSEEVSSEEAEKSTEPEVEESTRVPGCKVFASDGYISEMLASESDAIKGLLNSRQDTCGVARLSIKDSELWIHYNDNINLNNVMEPVIALLNSAGYSKLNFNRLARTENAIVFFLDEISNPVAVKEE